MTTNTKKEVMSESQTLENELADVLIVDDDSLVVLSLMDSLDIAGQSRFALNGTDALKMIEDSPPTLILLDVELPDINGLVMCAQIKANPKTSHIPVLIITSHNEAGFEEEVFDAGASDYISKPLNPRVVSARVKIHMAYQESQMQLDKLAHMDSLTGLANRRSFDKAYSQEMKRARRYYKPCSLMIIDIDEFKKFNDQFGHLQGDSCLRAVSESLRKTVKRPADLIARYGGEEFALLLPETDLKGAEFIARSLLNNVEKLNLKHAANAAYKHVTVSIGCSILEKDNIDLLDQDDALLIRVADQALYESKKLGRNRFSYKPITLDTLCY